VGAHAAVVRTHPTAESPGFVPGSERRPGVEI